jgi:hypothetical protein
MMRRRKGLEPRPFENSYQWLAYTYRRCMQDLQCAHRPVYVWGAWQGVALAKAPGIPRVSLIEFDVAYGGLRTCVRSVDGRRLSRTFFPPSLVWATGRVEVDVA